MISQNLEPAPSISLFVKNILVFEDVETTDQTVLPFFADGYPGLMFHETKNGLIVRPHNKQMPVLFLYGQTIKPIELCMDGPYKLIIFQLYPFILKSFFDVTAKDVTDGCYDLNQAGEGTETIHALLKQESTDIRIQCLTDFLVARFRQKKEKLDLSMLQGIQLILDSHGQLTVSELADKLNLTERTLERRFLAEAGVSPKQFLQIVQFNRSLEQLTKKTHASLTDLVYANGFADQSHFIRVFKAFTGKTPGKFLAQQ